VGGSRSGEGGGAHVESGLVRGAAAGVGGDAAVARVAVGGGGGGGKVAERDKRFSDVLSDVGEKHRPALSGWSEEAVCSESELEERLLWASSSSRYRLWKGSRVGHVCRHSKSGHSKSAYAIRA
jgi:hypothetical protein